MSDVVILCVKEWLRFCLDGFVRCGRWVFGLCACVERLDPPIMIQIWLGWFLCLVPDNDLSDKWRKLSN